ncbi:50S ribosomal protein L11 [Candidatus Persebacteraceae bacterium Df01]|jgi:large subunit ribosomal protein L11|uniref:Large ribosomal subunit protein uL11 n=1 Tax=Candidatus Doriopsillibacter californiensis TaxID=2970740 RepID=A0ABT7QN90_9GAMM|nr:50S ribosomal protein L11 [Candidatus Persebacteraceae bacterium Df01]
MGKKVVGLIKLQVPAGAATPAPPIGPALGQRGLNIQDFCKSFNAATESSEKGIPLPVIITCYEDRTFSFVVKKPPMSVLIKKSLGLEKGSGKPHMEKVGKLTRAAAEEIARGKMSDLNTADLDAAVREVAGTARSMGVEMEN